MEYEREKMEWLILPPQEGRKAIYSPRKKTSRLKRFLRVSMVESPQRRRSLHTDRWAGSTAEMDDRCWAGRWTRPAARTMSRRLRRTNPAGHANTRTIGWL
jgi:hypothetical protein